MASPDAIQVARRQFFSRGTVADNLVPHRILQSWSRCAALGLHDVARPRMEPPTSHELALSSERMEAFRRFCRPEIEALHLEAEATDSIVILTDANGVVLDTVGSPTFARQAARVALKPGMPWSEGATGTNAIGTALAEQSPIEVRGAEHYLECNHILTCSAAPIFGPRGEVMGVLDLSGPAGRHPSYALGLVRLAVEQIEHRLFEHGFEHCERIRLHRDPAMLGTTREGILIFEEERLIAANRHGLTLIGLTREAFGQAGWEEIFQDKPDALADRGEVRHAKGLLLHGQWEPSRARPASRLPASQRPQPARPQPVFDEDTTCELARAARLVEADIPLLVCGETGTGKEVFVRALHARGTRSNKPFVAVNCAALPETLMEAELFGYESGAFTGARPRGSKGRLREADGGMLFLDEIGDMPPGLQARLLRVLQDREVVPLGNGRPVPVNFSLVCATNHDLRELVRTGAFRADLYFRIASYTVVLKPLSACTDRRSLILRLWGDLGAAARDVSLSPDCLDHLARHDWPGNFRQLVGCLRAMMALGEPGQCLGPEALPLQMRMPPEKPVLPLAPPDASLDDIARTAMREAVEAANGNVSLAARRLGINRSTLYRRLLTET